MATPKQFRRRARFLIVLGTLVAAAVMVGIAGASVWTDQSDYTPGSTVTIHGGNNDAGQPGYVTGNTINVAVDGPNGWSDSCSDTVNDNGKWSCDVTLASDPLVAGGDYSYTATSKDANGDTISEDGTFTDSADTHGHVDFATTGLPASTPFSVTATWTNNGTTHTNTVLGPFSAPGYPTDTTSSQSADPGTSFSFTFPATVAGCTLTSQTSSPVTVPTASNRTTVTGNYSCATLSPDAGGPYTGNEGSDIALTGSQTGGVGTITYHWDVNTDGTVGGDTAGDTGIGCTFSPSADVQSPSINCNDDSNGGYFTLTLTVKDDNHSSGLTDTAQLTVNNVAPTVTFDTGLDTTVDENPTTTHHYTYTISDPGTNDTVTADSISPSCGSGDGAAVSNATNDSTSGSFDCLFPDGENPADTTNQVSAQATDDDGGTGSAGTLNVTVSNVAPTVGTFTANQSNCGVTISSVTFSDPGTTYDAPYTGTVNWGDGGGDISLGTVTSPIGPLTHTYAAPGNYTITISVTDEDGETGSNTASVNNNPTIGWPNAPILLGNGNYKSFNTGSAVPIKIKVIGCTAGLNPTVSITPSGTVKAKGKSNLSTNMRYDSNLPGFIYNWDTTGWAGGTPGTTYIVQVNGLPGGPYTAPVTLVK